MAIITKRRKAYSVIYQMIDTEGNKKSVWETFYDYDSAVRRKKQIENMDDKIIQITKDTKIIQYLYDYVSKNGIKLWSASRYESIMGILNNYLCKVLGDETLNDIDDAYVERLFQSLRRLPAIGKRNQKRSEFIPESMVYSCYTFLKSSFEYLVERGLIAYNPLHNFIVSICKETRHNKTEWNFEYIKQMFECCEDQRLFTALHLIFGCGLEMGELFGLSWEDIHFVNDKTCYINCNKIAKRLNLNTLESLDQSKVIKQFRSKCFTDTNTAFTLLYKDKSRRIIVPLQVAHVLKEWKVMQSKMTLVNRDEHIFVIDTETGTPYGERVFSKNFAKVKEKMNKKDLTLVKLRNFGKIVDENGISNAQKFYLNYPATIIMPKIKHKVHDHRGIVINKPSEFKNKMDSYIPVDKKDINVLLEQIQDSPELKMKLINRLREELL